jgi:hypothetical protein
LARPPDTDITAGNDSDVSAEDSLPQQAHVERHEDPEHHGQEPGKAREVVAGSVAEQQAADAFREVIQRIRRRDRGQHRVPKREIRR